MTSGKLKKQEKKEKKKAADKKAGKEVVDDEKVEMNPFFKWIPGCYKGPNIEVEGCSGNFL
jgi:hypothetical protein